MALVALGIALTAAAITLVPRVPRPTRAARAAALRDLPAGVVTRGRALHAALRPSSYGSMLAGLVVTLLLGFIASFALAQSPSEIARQIEQARDEMKIPGCAVAIVKDDKVILAQGFGVRDVERKLPVTADTLFDALLAIVIVPVKLPVVVGANLTVKLAD